MKLPTGSSATRSTPRNGVRSGSVRLITQPAGKRLCKDVRQLLDFRCLEIHTFVVKNIASISTLQAEAAGVVKQAEAEGVVPISRNGRTVAFMVSRDKMAAILETMELQKNAEFMELLRQDKAGKLKFTKVPDEI